MEEKIIRVNMSTLSTSTAAVPDEWAGLGGRGLTSTIVAKEVPPHLPTSGQIQQDLINGAD